MKIFLDKRINYFGPLNIAFWLVNQNNKKIKNADTPTPIIELKKNFVVISDSEKANNKFIKIIK